MSGSSIPFVYLSFKKSYISPYPEMNAANITIDVPTPTVRLPTPPSDAEIMEIIDWFLSKESLTPNQFQNRMLQLKIAILTYQRAFKQFTDTTVAVSVGSATNLVLALSQHHEQEIRRLRFSHPHVASK